MCGTCGARSTPIRSQRARLSSVGKLRHLASVRLTCMRWVLIAGISYDAVYVVKQKLQQGMEEAID